MLTAASCQLPLHRVTHHHHDVFVAAGTRRCVAAAVVSPACMVQKTNNSSIPHLSVLTTSVLVSRRRPVAHCREGGKTKAGGYAGYWAASSIAHGLRPGVIISISISRRRATQCTGRCSLVGTDSPSWAPESARQSSSSADVVSTASRCDHEWARHSIERHHNACAYTVSAWHLHILSCSAIVLATCDCSDMAQMSVCRHAMLRRSCFNLLNQP